MLRAVAATSGKTALHVRALLLLGGRDTWSSIRTMIALVPDRVVFAHGPYFGENEADRLRDAFAWLPQGVGRK